MIRRFCVLGALLLCLSLTGSSRYKPRTIRILAAFGYKDARPARFVGDRYEQAIFVQRLLSMGFARDPKNQELFSDPESRVHVEVIHASVGPDDDENRLDPFQKYKSKLTRERFLASVSRDDVVIYNGHSRDGGGPDFEPPLLRGDGHVDYAQYQQHPTQITDFVKAFNGTRERKGVSLALLSCFSEQHFQSRLKRACPECEIKTVARLIYYAEALDQMTEIVRRVLQDYRPMPDDALPRSAELD
ncbi:MAG: hypothetical protein JST80_04740 [Bdellovibrionales bacterium]|nr:hypothetical protein [Bdellovibrionales bacterium]